MDTHKKEADFQRILRNRRARNALALPEYSPFGLLYQGPIVAGPHELEHYTGDPGCGAIVGTLRQEACRANAAQLEANYDGGAESQLRQQAAILCPQTVDFLYTRFTPTSVHYRPGSRPQLEAVVQAASTPANSDRERAIALMRFCRDLYKRRPPRRIEDMDYIFGGTEEELIEKGEELCECLARLFVALCEVAGIPARIVAHVVGGHFAAEVFLDDHWGYIDPRCGVTFLRPDGVLASLWELWHNPVLWHNQPAAGRADVSDRWTWEQRVWACERKFFHPLEVNAFENYSLADAGAYDYCQVTQQRATELGMWEINRGYTRLIDRVFGLAGGGKIDRDMSGKLSLTYRNDGFTPYFYNEPPMTREGLERQFIDFLEGSNADVLEWGLGPGSVLCYDTKVGDRLGQDGPDADWATVRRGDRNVRDNLTALIEAGADPLAVAIERGHALGLKVHGGLRMNHVEWYGPEGSPTWTVLVGTFDRQPEFRIPGRFNPDYRHAAVRKRKMAVLREAAEAGCDGLSVCFCSWPPYFEDPEAGRTILTDFLRDARNMLDEVGGARDRRLALVARVPHGCGPGEGLDWPVWMRERLIDALVCTAVGSSRFFDVNLDDVIAEGKRCGVKVYGSIFQALGFVETDETPEDEERGCRHDKPKTGEMDCAQALLFHRAGVDGIELAMSGDEWSSRPWFNGLADPEVLERADKQYMVDPHPHMPVRLGGNPTDAAGVTEREVSLRIADDVAGAIEKGCRPEVAVVLYCRGLTPEERLEIYVNGHGPALVEPGGDERAPLSIRKKESGSLHDSGTGVTRDSQWWARGQRRVPINPEWLRMGHNTLRLVYSCGAADALPEVSIRWIEVTIAYGGEPNREGPVSGSHQ